MGVQDLRNFILARCSLVVSGFAPCNGTTMGILQNVEEHEKYLYNHDERIEALEKEKEKQKALIDKLMKELESLKLKRKN